MNLREFLLSTGAPEEDAVVVKGWLLERYSEPHRAYHNLTHIENMLENADGASQELSLAIWFHDSIYDPRRPDNEERSAEQAVRRLSWFAARSRVAELILLTKKHEVPPEDTDGCRLIDLDLKILATEALEYDLYRLSIRREYSHVSDDDFRAGRAQALRSFLARPHIFCGGEARERWERRARANIERELVELGADPQPLPKHL